MATIRTKPWARLNGYDILTWRISQEVNRGISWSATLPAGIDPVALAADEYVLEIGDGRGFSYTSPALVAKTGNEFSYSIEGGESGALSGRDKISWTLSQPNQSLPTFKNYRANAIINTIAATAGIAVDAPLLDFNVAEEDVKQSNWWDPLNRIAEVACCNWIVSSAGILKLVPIKWTGEPVDFLPESCRWAYDESRIITGFTVNKRTSHYQDKVATVDRYYTWDSAGYKFQQLRAGVLNPVAIDKSTIGSCSNVAFWDGNPNDEKSKIVSFQVLGVVDTTIHYPPATAPSSLATWMSLSVAKAAAPYDTAPVTARLEVQGSTPPVIPGKDLANVDLGFTTTVGTIRGEGARPGAVRNEALYPSKAWVDARATELLYESNKGANTVSASGPIDCRARLGGRLTLTIPTSIPVARIERIEHSGSIEGFSTSINGFVIPW